MRPASNNEPLPGTVWSAVDTLCAYRQTTGGDITIHIGTDGDVIFNGVNYGTRNIDPDLFNRIHQPCMHDRGDNAHITTLTNDLRRGHESKNSDAEDNNAEENEDDNDDDEGKGKNTADAKPTPSKVSSLMTEEIPDSNEVIEDSTSKDANETGGVEYGSLRNRPSDKTGERVEVVVEVPKKTDGGTRKSKRPMRCGAKKPEVAKKSGEGENSDKKRKSDEAEVAKKRVRNSPSKFFF